MTLAEAGEHIGHGVIYHVPGIHTERGVITSVNNKFVYVRYGNDFGSKATYPFDIELEV